MSPPTSTAANQKKDMKKRINVKAFVREARAKKMQMQQEGKEEEEVAVIASIASSQLVPSSSESKSKEPEELEPYFTIVSGDGIAFKIPQSVTRRLGSISALASDSGYKESNEGKLTLHQVEGHILKKVLQYCFEDSIFNPERGCSSATERQEPETPEDESRFLNPITRRRKGQEVIFLFSLKPEEVMDIMLAAHFLQVPRLVDIACKMLADNFLDVPTFEGVPDDIVLRILHYLPPHILGMAEKSFESLFTPARLDELWHSHFKRKQWHVKNCARIGSAKNTAFEEQLMNTGLTYKDLEITEGSELNKRELFLQTELDYLLRMFELNLASQDSAFEEDEEFTLDDEVVAQRKIEELFAYIEAVSPSIKQIKIQEALTRKLKIFSSEKLSKTVPPVIDDIISHLPHLRELDLSEAQILVGDSDRFSNFGNCVLASLKQLHSFRLTEVDLSAETIQVLANFLDNTKLGLESLDISGNKISIEGTKLLGAAIRKNYSLKALFLRGYRDKEVTNEAMRAIGENQDTKIKVLDFSKSVVNWGTTNLDNLRLFPQNRTITHLFLKDTRLNTLMEFEFEEFIKILPQSITHLDISNNLPTHKLTNFFAALQASTLQLTSLDLSDGILHNEACTAFKNWLLECNSITRLGLCSLNITQDEGSEIASAIRQRAAKNEGKPLIALILDDNKLGRYGFDVAQAFANQAQPTNDNVLSLSRNNLHSHYLGRATNPNNLPTTPIDPINDLKLHAGVRISALIKMETTKGKNIQFLLDDIY